MNDLLLIALVVVIAIFCIKKSRFTSIQQQDPAAEKTDVYHLDTRFDYPTVPPVNPMAYKTLMTTSIPVEHGLFSTQENIRNGNTESYILDQNGQQNGQQNGVPSTNQLNYSGGTTQLLKIPLQMNEPYNEQLRTQEVLITPYNRIKYQISNDC